MKQAIWFQDDCHWRTNLLTGKDGFIVARTIVELANGEEVTLKVNKKITVTVQHGNAPIINGVQESVMRIGCGSATIGLFADRMKEAVDECIVIDHHVVGLLSEHLAGREVGLTWTELCPMQRVLLQDVILVSTVKELAVRLLPRLEMQSNRSI